MLPLLMRTISEFEDDEPSSSMIGELDESSETEPSPELEGLPPLDPFGELNQQSPDTADSSEIDPEIDIPSSSSDVELPDDENDSDEMSMLDYNDFAEPGDGKLELPFYTYPTDEGETDVHGIPTHADENAETGED
jgi:hypothetical protein